MRVSIETVLLIVLVVILLLYLANDGLKTGLPWSTREALENMSSAGADGTSGSSGADGADGAGGVPASQIPQGQEDLYILKSSIVPPVCPKCPDVSITDCPKTAKCPPCPPCGRCPEPNFECKKVPVYNPNNSLLPMPVLADFSQFGQ